MAHESVNQSDNREARTSRVGDRGAATLRVPAEDLVGELQAAHRVRARCKLHAACWHMEDLCSACGIEHVRSFEEASKRLAIPAVADETEAGVRRNFVGDAAHVTAPAAKRQSVLVVRHARHPPIWRAPSAASADCKRKNHRTGDRSELMSLLMRAGCWV